MGPAWPAPARRGAACDRPAKHPLVRHGIHDATIDPAQLERWWQRWPQANLGLATGIVFDALDIDGPAGLAALRQLHGRRACGSPARWWPRGAVAGTTGSPRPGWATAHPAASPMSTGAASAGACSPHPAAMSPAAPTAGCATSTRPRCPRSRPPCAPCSTPSRQPRPDPTRPGRRRPAALGHPYGRRVLADELAALGRATPGHRNHTLNRTAFKVYRYVAGGLLDDQEVTARVHHDRPRHRPDPAEIGRTLASARTAGLANPAPSRPHPAPAPGGRVMTGRWTYRISAAGVLVLAAAAFTLSYDALHQLALDSRVRPALAWLWPVVIDGTIVVALLTVLAAKRAAARAAYPWALAGLFSPPRWPSISPMPPTGRSPSWCSPWPRSRWCSPPTCSCSRSAGDGQATRPPDRTCRRTAGRPRTRTPAQAGRPARTRAGAWDQGA